MSAESNPLPLRVVANPQAPYKFPHKGQPAGIDIEVLGLLMKELNVPYEVSFVRSDNRIHSLAENGEADMLLLFSKKPERERYLHYPKESYINISWHFFIRKLDENRIRYETLEDLKGLRVGATDRVAYTKAFWEAGLNIEKVPTNDLQIKKLIRKRIDIVALNTISTLYEGKNSPGFLTITYLPKPLTEKPYYNVFPLAATHPKLELIKSRYDEIIIKLKENGSIENILKRYLGDNYKGL